jgi:hypothetical protein
MRSPVSTGCSAACRFEIQSYLPLLLFGPSVTVPGSAYLLTPPFGMECLTSLADDITQYALC